MQDHLTDVRSTEIYAKCTIKPNNNKWLIQKFYQSGIRNNVLCTNKQINIVKVVLQYITLLYQVYLPSSNIVRRKCPT